LLLGASAPRPELHLMMLEHKSKSKYPKTWHLKLFLEHLRRSYDATLGTRCSLFVIGQWIQSSSSLTFVFTSQHWTSNLRAWLSWNIAKEEELFVPGDHLQTIQHQYQPPIHHTIERRHLERSSIIAQ
jgi:hypothetical protein